jgi:1-acyl-sn-glycerol-3-phosphate acyltransferase
MRTILAVIFLILYLILGLPVLGVEWIIAKFNKRAADISQLRIVQWAFRCILFLSGVKVVVRGRENIPKGEAVLYVGNHRSIFDIVATYPQCPELTGYIAKDSVRKVPVLGMWMQRLYCLFLVRDDLKQGMKVILDAIDRVKSGISICIFPEGTRNKDRENPQSLLPFKEGSFKIATKTGCRIVPMAITGSAEVFENQFPWIHSGTITITYGEPIDPKSLDKETQKKLGAYCRGVIEGMLCGAGQNAKV